MQEFAFFIGRFHVLALHLPIGLVLAAVALDTLSARPRHARLAAAVPFMWGTTAVSAVLAAALGYLHFAEGGFDGPAANAHRLYGTAVAIATMAVWWLVRHRLPWYSKIRVWAGALLVALVAVTGHYGGQLTHGSSYFVEYAPAPLRRLAGVAGPSAGPSAATVSGGPTVRSDPLLVARLYDAGFRARQVSQDDARLVVGVHSPGRQIRAEDLGALLSAADRIVELNLQDSALHDADIAGLRALSAVTHLRLSGNRLTDAALATLAALPQLQSLNLYGNEGITDAGLDTLAANPALRKLYLWRTQVTSAAVERLRARRPDLAI